jgi:nucleoside-diphosphate-sugar epimerase
MDTTLFIAYDSLLLVTGANGFVGTSLVGHLLQAGYQNLRCFVRSPSNRGRLDALVAMYPSASVEIMLGNLLAPDDCRHAVRGVSVIYHLAAGSGKSFPGCVLDSVVTTRNLLEAVEGSPELERFVNVSSLSVYSNRGLWRGSLLDETSPIDRNCVGRNDAYAFGKVKQDDVVVKYSRERGIPYVIVRPGVVFGPGRGGTILGRCGSDSFGLFVHISGRQRIPLTYVDNCSDAIMRAGVADGVEGEVFNVVDDGLPRSGALLRMVKRELGRFVSVRIPYHVFYLFCWLWEKYVAWSHNQLPPVFNRRMCSVYYKGNRYSNEKLKRLLGWKPSVPMDEALRRYFAYMRGFRRK